MTLPNKTTRSFPTGIHHKGDIISLGQGFPDKETELNCYVVTRVETEGDTDVIHCQRIGPSRPSDHEIAKLLRELAHYPDYAAMECSGSPDGRRLARIHKSQADRARATADQLQPQEQP
jgi:hypothetical protein